jgi:hypothetical protein
MYHATWQAHPTSAWKNVLAIVDAVSTTRVGKQEQDGHSLFGLGHPEVVKLIADLKNTTSAVSVEYRCGANRTRTSHSGNINLTAVAESVWRSSVSQATLKVPIIRKNRAKPGASTQGNVEACCRG